MDLIVSATPELHCNKNVVDSMHLISNRYQVNTTLSWIIKKTNKQKYHIGLNYLMLDIAIV
jgi:hypothetical protein